MLTLKGTIEMEAYAFGPNGNFVNDQALDAYTLDQLGFGLALDESLAIYRVFDPGKAKKSYKFSPDKDTANWQEKRVNLGESISDSQLERNKKENIKKIINDLKTLRNYLDTIKGKKNPTIGALIDENTGLYLDGYTYVSGKQIKGDNNERTSEDEYNDRTLRNDFYKNLATLIELVKKIKGVETLDYMQVKYLGYIAMHAEIGALLDQIAAHGTEIPRKLTFISNMGTCGYCNTYLSYILPPGWTLDYIWVQGEGVYYHTYPHKEGWPERDEMLNPYWRIK